MSKSYFASFFSVALLVGSAFAATPVTTSLVEDHYYMVSHNNVGGINSSAASTFSYPAGFAGLTENFRGGRIDMKFAVSLPETITGEYTVKSAKVVLWHTDKATRSTWDPTATPAELFALGFASPHTEAEYLTPGFTFPDYTTNPFLIDPVTETNATFASTPWAVGTHPDYPYAEGDTNYKSFEVTFDLDVNNPVIQSALKADLTSGFSSWSVTSKVVASFGGPTPSPSYPEYHVRGVSGDDFVYPAAPAQVPALVIEVEPASTSAAADWNLFN